MAFLFMIISLQRIPPKKNYLLESLVCLNSFEILLRAKRHCIKKKITS